MLQSRLKMYWQEFTNTLSGNLLYILHMTQQNETEATRKQTLDAALSYYERGWSVIPIGNNKKPLVSWKEFQKRCATPEEIKAWAQQYPDMNIAVVTGKISGIVVVDIEKDGSTTGYPDTVTASSGGGGWHLYYRYPNTKEVGRYIKFRPETDLCGDNGYVVLPPSRMSPELHAGAYEWILPPEDADMAGFPLELLEEVKHTTSNQVPEKIPEGRRNDSAAKVVGHLLKKIPQAKWEDVAWQMLRSWNNDTCNPPLPEAELRSVFDSIANRERTPAPATDREWSSCTLNELMTQEFSANEWIAKDLIPLGGVTAVTGASSSYKTFLTHQLAICISTGQPFLGRFPVKRGKVLFVDEENQKRILQGRFKALGIEQTSGITFLTLNNIQLDSERDLNKLRRFIELQQPDLVVFDSLVRFHSGEENSAKDMAKIANAFRQLSGEDRTILFLHHHRKPQMGERIGTNSIRGSSDILAAVDCHIAVERKRDENRIIIAQTKLRVQEELHPFIIQLNRENERVSFTYLEEDHAEEDKRLEEQAAVEFVLLNATEPKGIAELVAETNLPSTRVRAVIKDLFRMGRVKERNERGKAGKKFYVLVPSQPETIADSSF